MALEVLENLDFDVLGGRVVLEDPESLGLARDDAGLEGDVDAREDIVSRDHRRLEEDVIQFFDDLHGLRLELVLEEGNSQELEVVLELGSLEAGIERGDELVREGDDSESGLGVGVDEVHEVVRDGRPVAELGDLFRGALRVDEGLSLGVLDSDGHALGLGAEIESSLDREEVPGLALDLEISAGGGDKFPPGGPEEFLLHLVSLDLAVEEHEGVAAGDAVLEIFAEFFLLVEAVDVLGLEDFGEEFAVLGEEEASEVHSVDRDGSRLVEADNIRVASFDDLLGLDASNLLVEEFSERVFNSDLDLVLYLLIGRYVGG